MDNFADCTKRGAQSATKLYNQKKMSRERGFAESITAYFYIHTKIAEAMTSVCLYPNLVAILNSTCTNKYFRVEYNYNYFTI